MARLLPLSFIFILASQLPVSWFPGSTYDPAIPTPQSVLGHEIGEYYTEHLQMTGYMRRLESASPRVKVFRAGETNERRELILVVVSEPENIQRLESIRSTIEELRDPRKTSEARAREIAASTPAVAWMNFANDGNESAALETAIQLAYQLAAGQDAASRKILKEVVTVIYPAHNPESHSRHVAWMKASATGNPDPAAQEHRGDWRMDANNNHYQIDLNRDAVFQSQVESQVVVREMHRWNPVLFVDHHGNPDRFFFPPWAIPVNPQLDDTARRWVNTYGKDIASAFDRNGWTYFTRNVFDLHYPGYYDTYPTLNGATGMTFETDGGGNKGLAYELPDGRVTTLRDGILHHFTGAMATLVTTSECRSARLMDLYNFRADALKEAAADKLKQYVLLPGRDRSNAADLVDLLLKHKIEVHRTRAGFSSTTAHGFPDGSAARRSFPPESFLVYANQPQKRLLRTLLDPETPLQPEFLEAVRKAKTYNDGTGSAAPKKSYGFYDINAWSLPMAYGVEAYWTEERFDGPVEPITSRPGPSFGAPGRAAFAYIFPWNSRGATRLLSGLWEQGFKLSLAREPFTLAGLDYPAGTVVVRVQPNADSIHTALPGLAAQNEVEVTAAATALVDKGKDLGDESVVDLKAPSIAVVCEPPTSPTAFGAIWFMLEKMYGIPFTAIKAADIADTDLRRYDVIVLPDGRTPGYARLFERELDRLRNWVREGGTLVCIKGAAAWAAAEKTALTTARDRYAEPEAADKSEKPKEPPKRIDTVPGVFVRLRVDAHHYLGTGIEGPIAALFRSNVVFTSSEKGARVARIDADRPVMAGFTFDDGRDALKGADFIWDEPTGRGHVICFADDVTFRTFLHAAHRLFLNSILLPSSEEF